jgi:hypothetical protein
MIGTPSASPAIDDAARLRANPATSWGAIFAGAVVAVALSLILLTLGAGLGFASVSPWSDHGLSASAFTVASTIWLIVTQWLSAAAGGYIAGRLRHRWLATHTHEVFFRDTAHGLVTWAVATLFATAVVAGSATSVLGGAVHAVGRTAAAGGEPAATMGRSELRGERNSIGPDSIGAPSFVYDLDKLFRGNASSNSTGNGQDHSAADDARVQVMHIGTTIAMSGAVSDEDRQYLAYLVATKAGISTDEAKQRVNTFIQSVKDASEQAKAVVDEARKSAATAALYTALALLIGAFIASVSAAIGGRLRDEHL